MSMLKIPQILTHAEVPQRVATRVREWHQVEVSSRRLLRALTDDEKLFQQRIAAKALPAIVHTAFAAFPPVLKIAAKIAKTQAAHYDFNARQTLQADLARVQAQLEEQKANLQVATRQLDALARGGPAVEALVNGLRQSTAHEGPVQVERAGKARPQTHPHALEHPSA